jgi:uncharacterized protein (DUF305 family)
MYGKLALAVSINTVIMFLITYVMIAEMDHFVFNINSVYMTLLMAAPMVVIMLLVMRSMFEDARRNYLIMAAAIAASVALFALTRTQTPVGDVQFLRSMIPHHSSAILMCEQSAISDPEILELCGEIVRAQEDEIAQMQAILRRY